MARAYRVGVDCDGVLSNLLSLMLKVASQLLAREVKEEEIRTYDWLAKLLPRHQLSYFWDLLSETGNCRNLLVYPGAVKGLSRLFDVAEPYIITSPPSSGRTWTHERNAWLYEHFSIPSNRVIHTQAKHTFDGDMLIDDHPEHLEAWAEDREGLGSRKVACLWAQPYNQSHVFPDFMKNCVFRTNDWSEVVAVVQARKCWA